MEVIQGRVSVAESTLTNQKKPILATYVTKCGRPACEEFSILSMLLGISNKTRTENTLEYLNIEIKKLEKEQSSIQKNKNIIDNKSRLEKLPSVYYAWFEIVTAILLILYNFLKLFLTYVVTALRDHEERTDRTPPLRIQTGNEKELSFFEKVSIRLSVYGWLERWAKFTWYLKWVALCMFLTHLIGWLFGVVLVPKYIG
jgi:hypothetical protein